MKKKCGYFVVGNTNRDFFIARGCVDDISKKYDWYNGPHRTIEKARAEFKRQARW